MQKRVDTASRHLGLNVAGEQALCGPFVHPARRNVDGADGMPYIRPGPWKSSLTEKDVIGVWLGFGVGAPKQFFIIERRLWP